MTAPTRAPEDSRARRVRKGVGDGAARHRSDDQLQIGAAIDVGAGRGSQGAVPGLFKRRRREVDSVQLLAQIAEGVKLAAAAGRLLGPGRKAKRRVAVV